MATKRKRAVPLLPWPGPRTRAMMAPWPKREPIPCLESTDPDADVRVSVTPTSPAPTSEGQRRSSNG